jgi:hypothetical protein
MSLFHSSQHWTDTYITRGFSPHILLPGFYNQPARTFINNTLRGLFIYYLLGSVYKIDVSICLFYRV